ncbi:MAG: hypothetical protein GEU71_18320, partial [Actinobacteria bacterium]|nr:hypothetical protein [Actinomycetota bacterium]
IELVAPGDDVRIVHILDVAEPRVRISDPGVDFPGIVGPLHPVGTGVTNRMSGIAITQTVGVLPTEPTYWREAILDMSGDGAGYSTFSALRHVVLSFKPSDVLSFEDGGDESLHNVFEGSPEVMKFKNEMRAAALRTAVYLAETTKDLAPDWVDVYERPGGKAEGLPKMIYMYQVQGPRFYGEVLPRAGAMTAAAHLPLFVNPAEVLDGALVSMSSLGGCKRDITYLMQNHPVIKEMYRRHGEDIDFRGMLLCSNGDNVRSKQTIATTAAGVARYLGADGVVLNHLGGGHPMVDVMLGCKELEKHGIRTVLMLMEMSSTPGESGFVDFVSEADAIVSTGNFEEIAELKPVSRVIGGTKIMELGDDAAGPLNITIRHILAATSTFGVGLLRGADR